MSTSTSCAKGCLLRLALPPVVVTAPPPTLLKIRPGHEMLQFVSVLAMWKCIASNNLMPAQLLADLRALVKIESLNMNKKRHSKKGQSPE